MARKMSTSSKCKVGKREGQALFTSGQNGGGGKWRSGFDQYQGFVLNHATPLPLLIGFEFWKDKDNVGPCDTPLKSTAAASPGLHHIRYKKLSFPLEHRNFEVTPLFSGS